MSGPVAQLVEQRIENPRVGGSIPSQATKFKPLSSNVQGFLIFCVFFLKGCESCYTIAVSAHKALLGVSGPVAQLVEQRIENPRVGGSIPSQATKIQSP